MKEPAEEGGGPAGVVDGLEAPKEYCFEPSFDRLSGVDGGLEEKGTWKPDMAAKLLCDWDSTPVRSFYHETIHRKLRMNATSD